MVQLHLFQEADRVVVFDVETKRSFQDVGGRQNLKELGVSLAVLYDYATGEYHTFREENVSALVDELLSASLVIGYNNKNFDYPVLSAYRPEVSFKKIPTLDLMEKVQEVIGFRIGLDNLASATLGRGKSAGGLDALRWFREGRFDLIEKYCRDDVEVTRLVWEYGRDHGRLKYRDRQGCPVEFSIRWPASGRTLS